MTPLSRALAVPPTSRGSRLRPRHDPYCPVRNQGALEVRSRTLSETLDMEPYEVIGATAVGDRDVSCRIGRLGPPGSAEIDVEL